MSYNYLPLDRKWLHFQQVKNLLDYDQLVSITFDAHERILKAYAFLSRLSPESEYEAPSPNHLLKGLACGTGEEVPADIVKLMLMLKIKSLSYGHSVVKIETVKRLMEMYNNGVLSVIYGQGTSGVGGDTSALAHLSLPLIALGEVNFEGKRRKASDVLTELNWQPTDLHPAEITALTTGIQFTTAYGLYSLKKAAQLLKMADLVAALSLASLGFAIDPFAKISSVHHYKGQAETAAKLQEYLQGSETTAQKKRNRPAPASLNSVPQVHGAAKDSFSYVLNVFLNEINSVSEASLIFPDESLVLTGAKSTAQPLALAADFLAIAINGLGSLSEKRTGLLSSDANGDDLELTKAAEVTSGTNMLRSVAAGLMGENTLLCTPASAITNEDAAVSNAANAAIKCLQLINNVEKVLAIELISVMQAIARKPTSHTPPALHQLEIDFRQHFLLAGNDSPMSEKITKAVQFVSSYKF